MSRPAARVTDMHACVTPVVPGPPAVPPVPAPILPPCAITVLIGGLPAARMGDLLTAAPPHPIMLGSFTVLTMNQPQARIGDVGACAGPIIPPCQINVLVGG